jgi:hypothetical protein
VSWALRTHYWMSAAVKLHSQERAQLKSPIQFALPIWASNRQFGRSKSQRLSPRTRDSISGGRITPILRARLRFAYFSAGGVLLMRLVLSVAAAGGGAKAPQGPPVSHLQRNGPTAISTIWLCQSFSCTVCARYGIRAICKLSLSLSLSRRHIIIRAVKSVRFMFFFSAFAISSLTRFAWAALFLFQLPISSSSDGRADAFYGRQ